MAVLKRKAQAEDDEVRYWMRRHDALLDEKARLWTERDAALAEVERLREDLREHAEVLDRIIVCCDNGSEPTNKLTFIRRVASDARA